MTTHTERNIGDGIHADFYIPIPQSIIAVTVNGVGATYARPHEQIVRITPTPAVGTNVDITYTMLDQPALGGGSTGPTSSDPDFASVIYVSNFDQVATRPAFFDASSAARGVSGFNGANTSTTQKKWGNTSFRCSGTGVSGSFLMIDTFALGLLDFCIEGWTWLDGLPTAAPLFDGRANGLNGAYPDIAVENTGAILYYVNSAVRITSPVSTVTTGAWFHWAVARVSGNTRLFYNGNQVGSTWVDATDYQSGNGWIGNSAFQNASFAGYSGGVRITKGVGRYSGATLTVPTEAFPYQ